MTARKVHIVLILVCVLLPFTASAQVAPSRPSYKLTPLPRDLEIELALSALPPHLRDGATVYVLNPAKGFEVARKGSNEFHALVARTGDDTFRGSWPFTEYRDDILYPIGFDKAGANAQMRVFLDAAELQAKGTPATELKTIIKERYATKHYRSPERAGVAYMLSPVLRTYFDPEHGDQVATVNIPHVMYHAPNVSSADIGAGPIGPGNPYPFLIMPGPHGYSVQLLGAVEAAAVTKQYEEMLARLCRIKDLWCLPAAKER